MLKLPLCSIILELLLLSAYVYIANMAEFPKENNDKTQETAWLKAKVDPKALTLTRQALT